MPKKSRWLVLYFVLLLLIAFSLFAVPKIAINAMDETKGQIITVDKQSATQ